MASAIEVPIVSIVSFTHSGTQEGGSYIALKTGEVIEFFAPISKLALPRMSFPVGPNLKIVLESLMFAFFVT